MKKMKMMVIINSEEISSAGGQPMWIGLWWCPFQELICSLVLFCISETCPLLLQKA